MRVKVDYLFSKSDLVGSRLISWGTKHLSDEADTPSHIAILINDRWVLESTAKTGVRIISYKTWLTLVNEIAKIPSVYETKDYSEIKKIFKEIKNKKYDYLGVIYLGIYVALNKYFNKKIPNKNKWESDNKYFCCEAVEKLTGMASTSMKAPVQILAEFR